MSQITAAKRKVFAEKAGVDEQYLYQCLTGRRDMNPSEARRVEAVTKRALRRWDLCQKTWHTIWPECIGKKGAPPVPTSEAA